MTRTSFRTVRAAWRCGMAAATLLVVLGCGDSEPVDPIVVNSPPQLPPVDQQPGPEVDEPAESPPSAAAEQVTPFRLKEVQRVQVGMARTFQVSQDRRTMVGCSEDRRSILVWDIAGKTLRATLVSEQLGDGLLGRIAVSPDGSQLAAQIDEALLPTIGEVERTRVAIWNMENPDEERFVTVPSLKIGSMAISSTELMVAYGPHVLVYSHLDGTHLANLSGHQDDEEGTASVRAVKLSPSGRFLLSMGSDRIALLWNLQTRKEVQIFDEHQGEVTCGVFSDDEKTIVTGSEDLSVKLWDVASGTSIRTWQLAEYDALKVAERKSQALIERLEGDVAAAQGRARFMAPQVPRHTVITGVDLTHRSSTLLVNLFVGLKEDGSEINTLFPGNPVLLDVVTGKPVPLAGFLVNQESIAQQMSLGRHSSFFNRRGDGVWFSGHHFVRSRGKSIPRHVAREFQLVGYPLTNAEGIAEQIELAVITHRDPSGGRGEAAVDVDPSGVFEEDGAMVGMMEDAGGMMAGMEGGDGMMGGGVVPLDLVEEMKGQERDEIFLRDFGEHEFLEWIPEGAVTDIDGTMIEYGQVAPLLQVFRTYLATLKKTGADENEKFHFQDLTSWAQSRGQGRGHKTFPPGLQEPGSLVGRTSNVRGDFILVSVSEVDGEEATSVSGEHLLGGAVDERVRKRFLAARRAQGAGIPGFGGGIEDMEGMMEGMMEGNPGDERAAYGMEDKIVAERELPPGLFFCQAVQSYPENRTGNRSEVNGPSVMGPPLLVDGGISDAALGALRRALLDRGGYVGGMEGMMEGGMNSMMEEGGMAEMFAMGEEITGFTAEGVDSLLVRACMLLRERPESGAEVRDESGQAGAEPAKQNHPLAPHLVEKDRFIVRVFIDVERIKAGSESLTKGTNKRIDAFIEGVVRGLGKSRSPLHLEIRLLNVLQSEDSPLSLVYLFGPDSLLYRELYEERMQRLDQGLQSTEGWVSFSKMEETVASWQRHLGPQPWNVERLADGVEITGKGKIRCEFDQTERDRFVLSGVKLLEP